MRASRENRAERLSERADKIRREANSAMDSAHKMASVIPMGQPILIGHHSEKRDRNYRAKIDSKMRKGFELAEYADSLEARAEAAANNTAIYADDIDPIGKLDARIAELENERDAIKARKHETWELTNIGANIRRLKERRDKLAMMKASDKIEETINGIRIVADPEIARVQMYFDGKPSEEVRGKLKANGFRWAPSEGAWQRGYNQWAFDLAKKIASDIENKEDSNAE